MSGLELLKDERKEEIVLSSRGFFRTMNANEFHVSFLKYFYVFSMGIVSTLRYRAPSFHNRVFEFRLIKTDF